MVKESQGTRHIDYSFAREMAPFYIDSMVIPAYSPKVRDRLELQKICTPEEARAFSRAWQQWGRDLPDAGDPRSVGLNGSSWGKNGAESGQCGSWSG